MFSIKFIVFVYDIQELFPIIVFLDRGLLLSSLVNRHEKSGPLMTTGMLHSRLFKSYHDLSNYMSSRF